MNFVVDSAAYKFGKAVAVNVDKARCSASRNGESVELLQIVGVCVQRVAAAGNQNVIPAVAVGIDERKYVIVGILLL